MIYKNRQEAGRKLAAHLARYANRDDVTVLGIPRGGVPVAFEVARALNAPMDVFVLRKLGVPGHDELAFGAIGSGGVRVLNASIVHHLGLTELEMAAVTRTEAEELARRERVYRGGRQALDVRGRTVILVDDGIATGSSLLAAVHAVRKLEPAAIVVAAPVAPHAICDRFAQEADEVICAETPEPFYGVGQFYADFSQVQDKEVIHLLSQAPQRQTAEKPEVLPETVRVTLS